MDDATIFDLISAFNDALKRVKIDEIGEIFATSCTVADKIETILELIRRKEQIVFSALFEFVASRHEVICTFLALLELIRLRQVSARQNGAFSDIVVVRVG